MEMYNHHKVGESVIVNNVSNRPVAVVTEDMEFSFIAGSGENEANVRDYCIRMGLCKDVQPNIQQERKKTYTYQLKNQETCIVKNANNQLVVIIEGNKFQFMGVGEETTVKEFCMEHGLWPKCKGRYTHKIAAECCVVKDEYHRTVAIIEGENFRFMPNSGADESDVRLYCIAKGILK